MDFCWLKNPALLHVGEVEVQCHLDPHSICQYKGGHTLSDHAALSHCYPGESACLTRRHTGHHSGTPSCVLQPCGLPHCPSLKCPAKINVSSLSEPLSSPSASVGSSSSFPKKTTSGKPEVVLLQTIGITPRRPCFQTLTQLGLSCQNSTHWNWKNVALISSLENGGFEMASGEESMMGYMVFDIQWHVRSMDVDVHVVPEKEMCGDGWDDHHLRFLLS